MYTSFKQNDATSPSPTVTIGMNEGFGCSREMAAIGGCNAHSLTEVQHHVNIRGWRLYHYSILLVNINEGKRKVHLVKCFFFLFLFTSYEKEKCWQHTPPSTSVDRLGTELKKSKLKRKKKCKP